MAEQGADACGTVCRWRGRAGGVGMGIASPPGSLLARTASKFFSGKLGMSRLLATAHVTCSLCESTCSTYRHSEELRMYACSMMRVTIILYC